MQLHLLVANNKLRKILMLFKVIIEPFSLSYIRNRIPKELNNKLPVSFNKSTLFFWCEVLQFAH